MYVEEWIFLGACLLLAVLHLAWVAWKFYRQPKPQPDIDLVVWSLFGPRLRIVGSKRSEVDNRRLYWRAVDDGGVERRVPLNLEGFRAC